MTSPHAIDDSLIRALQDPTLYPHPVEHFTVLQTHISWVILTGPYAYKIKKPLNLGFLDFSTLELRHHYCEEELRLNRRTAPELYLEVVSIHGTSRRPSLIDSQQPIIEYAVKMRQFDQALLMDRVQARGELTGQQIDQLAIHLAAFHRQAASAGSDTPYGTAQTVQQPVRENIEQIRALIDEPQVRQQVDTIAQWSDTTHQRLLPLLTARHQLGRIRECHGDLHLGNMVLLDGRVTPFDCLEFNEKLRIIDVISEIAFLLMDLQHRQHPDLAWRFLDRYLQQSGDYHGAPLLPYYLCYRAMVRAKVAAIRSAQNGISETDKSNALQEFTAYLSQALTYTKAHRGVLLITHGLSGSGKSYYSDLLLQKRGMLRLRSDVVRKHLHGMAPTQQSGSTIAGGIYNQDATTATYAQLLHEARAALESGIDVIVDATFIKQQQRKPFMAMAAELNVPFLILDLQAPVDVLRQRIQQRQHDAQDASEADLAVLQHQLAQQEPLTMEEARHQIAVNTCDDLEVSLGKIAQRLNSC